MRKTDTSAINVDVSGANIGPAEIVSDDLSEKTTNSRVDRTVTDETTIDEAEIFNNQENESEVPDEVVIYTKENISELDFLFEPQEISNNDGLLGAVQNREMKALTVEFDNIIIKPGMKVKDIIDTSYWYTTRENDVLEAGEAGFLVLENDFWTNDDIKLNNDVDSRNGDIVLWVHNYDNQPAEMRDCVIYKYQISYLGCDNYYERPDLKYYDIYEFGKNEFPAICESITGITTDRGSCTRYILGDISTCQVFLDADDNGLIGITVSYNEFYGPDFDEVVTVE